MDNTHNNDNDVETIYLLLVVGMLSLRFSVLYEPLVSRRHAGTTFRTRLRPLLAITCRRPSLQYFNVLSHSCGGGGCAGGLLVFCYLVAHPLLLFITFCSTF